MDTTAFRSFTEALMAVGGLRIASMTLYKTALRHVDRALIPKAALPRVRW
ncbi:hypothetical protein [Streptomyces capitiformicae]|uniref:Integrase n=1 Tax=Streptomyces capitiformicae TaxID=2014920 RepID=A0A918Z8F9_9ACTN|nr:hypothetical protein [Streptomyces capitiformicae]GHE41628.1 hypothetical protein GCM10017771_60950 [Streptomyces capitiformicae]